MSYGGGYVDDCYITDGEFLGNVRIVPIYAIADGSTDQWTANGSTPNFNCVNALVWGLSDYVSCPAAGVGNLDEYFLGAPLYAGKIMGVQFLWNLGKTDAGVATITATLVNGATTENVTFLDGYTAIAPSDDSLIFATAPYRKSSFTGNDWTLAEILATQVGMTRAT